MGELATHSARRPAAGKLPGSTRSVIAAAFAVLACLMFLTHLGNDAVLWTRVQLTFASGLSLGAALLSMRGTRGRVRHVRGWITLAIAFWLVADIIRNVEVSLGLHPELSLSDLSLLAVLGSAGRAYVVALRGRLGPSDELAVYLDGGMVFFATTALMLTAFGHVAGRTLSGAVDLTYAIFFIATAGATLLLDVAVRAERRLRGAYVLLIGLLLLGIAFLWRLAAPQLSGLPEGGPPAHFLSLGVMVVMLGTITWTDTVDEHPGYVRFAARMRSGMPILAIAVTPFLVVAHVANPPPDASGILNIASVGLVLLTVAARQSVLLNARESAMTRERALSTELTVAEAKYRALVERQPGVVYLAEPGPDGRWHYVSPQIEAMLGYPAGAWLADATLWARTVHPEDRKAILGSSDALTTGRSAGTLHREYRLLAADGSVVWVLDDGSVTQFTSDGRPALVQGVMLDITQRKRAEHALQASEAQTRTIIETASYAFVGMDGTGRVIDWNHRATETFGWTRAEALGTPLADLIIPRANRAAHAEEIDRYIATGQGPLLNKRVEVVAQHRDGYQFPVELTIWPIDLGGELRFNALVDDITVRKQLEDQLRHQALHDSLTGLPNRALFVDRLQNAIARRKRTGGSPVAVLFLDLDDFKTVNDSLGHDAGDRLLVVVADRLCGALREGDTAARLGGDEFAILVEDAAVQPPAILAARLLEQVSGRVRIGHQSISAHASIGIAVSGEHGVTPEELLRSADLAMYLAKARGKNRHEQYERGMHEQAVRRLSMKHALEQAIAADGLEVHYQPIVALEDGTVVGVEALLRWRGKDGQFVPIPEVIALAEESGLILPIGRFVMERACRDATVWQAQIGPNRTLDVAINVSVIQLEHGTLLEDVNRALAASGLSPSSLVLEITESALSSDSIDSIRTIKALRARGIRLALDDFGTGYSSLARLRHFPVDIVKIDRTFVRSISNDTDGVLTQSIIDLGRTLHMEIIAEGIETAAQVVALRARGAQLGQGYHFARPMPAEAIAATLGASHLPPRLGRTSAEAVGASAKWGTQASMPPS